MDPVTVAILMSVFEGVLRAVPEAIAAYKSIQDMAANHRDPSPDEWKSIAAASAAAHAQLQAAVQAQAPVPVSA